MPKGGYDMKNEFVVRRCKSCGAIVRVMEDCECACGIECCGEKMEMVKANSEDAAAEKHIPTYEIVDGRVMITVNHVMEENHYIEWIAIVRENYEKIIYFQPGDEPKAGCRYIPGTKIYAWCNKHLLWVKEVE